MSRFMKTVYEVYHYDDDGIISELDYVIKDTTQKANHREIFRTRNETFADAILFLFDLYFSFFAGFLRSQFLELQGQRRLAVRRVARVSRPGTDVGTLHRASCDDIPGSAPRAAGRRGIMAEPGGFVLGR